MVSKDSTDIVIIGAGLIGSSIAYHLLEKKPDLAGKIVMLDLDLHGRFSSSELNAGGIRAGWWHDINIKLSKATIEFLESDPPHFGFRQKGYLWLYDDKHWRAFQSHKAIYKKEGLEVEELTPKEVQTRVPYIDRLEGIAGATFSPRDGIFNPNLLKQCYRSQARAKGVTLIDGAYVRKVEKKKGLLEISYADIRGPNGRPNEDQVLDILSQKKTDYSDNPKTLSCKTLINAGGAWASKLASLYGHAIDCQPVRRQVSIFDCHGMDLSPYGMIVDTSGVYFHAEADHILSGYATPNEPTGFNYTYEGEDFFQEYIWPNLMKRMSAAEALKHVTGWAGFYSQSSDRTGILGKVDPEYSIYEAHSFTGRGAMQSYGIGRAMAELVVSGTFETIDATCLHPDRFTKPSGKLLYEGFHI